MTKTPKTDKALDDVVGILRSIPSSEAARERLTARVAEIRSVPSAVVRCASALSIIDLLVRESSASNDRLADAFRADPAIGILATVIENLRKLRKGLQVELNQARARAALGATGY